MVAIFTPVVVGIQFTVTSGLRVAWEPIAFDTSLQNLLADSNAAVWKDPHKDFEHLVCGFQCRPVHLPNEERKERRESQQVSCSLL